MRLLKNSLQPDPLGHPIASLRVYGELVEGGSDVVLEWEVGGVGGVVDSMKSYHTSLGDHEKTLVQDSNRSSE